MSESVETLWQEWLALPTLEEKEQWLESFIQNVRPLAFYLEVSKKGLEWCDERPQAEFLKPYFYRISAHAFAILKQFREAMEQAYEGYNLTLKYPTSPVLRRQLRFFLGRFLCELGYYEKSYPFLLEYYEEAQEDKDLRREMYGALSLAQYHSFQEEYLQAIELTKRSLELAIQKNFSVATGASYFALAEYYLKNGTLLEAHEAILSCLETYAHIPNPIEPTMSYRAKACLGEVYNALGDFGEAEVHLVEALEGLPDKFIRNRTECLRLLALNAHKDGRSQQALRWLDEALSFVDELNDAVFWKDLLMDKCSLLESLGEFESALECALTAERLTLENHDEELVNRASTLDWMHQMKEVRREFEYEQTLREQELDKQRRMHQLKNEVASMMSHDLKNPMAVLRSCLLLMDSDELLKTTGARAAAENIEKEIERMLRLVSCWLDLTRLGTGKLQKQTLLLTPWLKEWVEKQTEVLTKKGQSLLWDNRLPEDVMLLVDSLQLWDALEHLLSNASLHSQSSLPFTLRTGQNKGSVWMELEDRGVGIPEEARHKIFERFYRHPSTPHTEGAGLGLSIVSTTMTLHEGEISLRPRVQGACFRLVFPSA